MAPLHQAINAEYAYSIEGKDARAVYRGQVDVEWTVFKVPHGGYILGLILESVVKHQSGSNHPDPIHLTAHFIKSAMVGPFEVHIRVIKTGKGFRNLTATFVQRDEDLVLTHIICGTLNPDRLKQSSSSVPNATIEPPSPYTVQIPMYTHPSKAKIMLSLQRHSFGKHILRGRDPLYEQRMRAAPGVGGVDWGEYITLTDEGDRLAAPMLAFLVDCHMPLPILLPELKSRDIWLPSMVITLEFKFPIPQPLNTHCSQRTVAVYSRGKFVNDPSARHDTYVELWTAPTNLGEGTENGDWKEHQRCLAVGTQMALVIPADVNRKKAEKTKL